MPQLTSAEHEDGAERLAIVRDAELPGVELKTVSRATRMWRVFHEKYTLVSPTRGASTRTFRGRSIVRRPGELMLYEPGDFDTNTHFEPETAFHVVSIESPVLDAMLSEAGERHAWSFVRSDVSAPALAEAVHELARAMHEDDADARADALTQLVDEIACHHLRDATGRRSERGSARDRSMIRVCDRLHSDLYGSLGLDQLADEMKLDKYQLLRRFKSYCGTTPTAYRQALRVARARTLLRHKKQPSEVSELLGFSDFSHFRRMFVKYAGMSPSQYRHANVR